MDFNSGGKKVIERLVEAYGYSTRQALCDHLGVSKSTMATRYMRDIFPADWVLRCAMETGVSLEWLSFGKGRKQGNTKADTIEVSRKNLSDGKMEDVGVYSFDKKFLPPNLEKIFILEIDNIKYFADEKSIELNEGKWILDMDGTIAIKDIFKLPAGKIRVSDSNIIFDCNVDDVKIIAKVVCVATFITQ